jgi:NADP+-dependent farnesol dehydrogenase
MEQWKGKIAVVTGASAGIGAATALDLVNAGMIVVGLARRQDRIEELKKKLPTHLKRHLHAMRCDVSVEADIVKVFADIEKIHGGIDVLINNAGILRAGDIMAPGNTDILMQVMQTNLMAPIFCTREAVRSMKQRGGVGHIVHVNSVAGHKVPIFPATTPSFNIYAPTKYAVTAMTEVMRQELVKNQSKIKVTVSVSDKFFFNVDTCYV